jgi:hypothetical protein
MKWLWISLGVAAGFLVGNRGGREQVLRWTKRTAQDAGVTSASEHVLDSARSVGKEVREAATSKSADVLAGAADSITDKLDAVKETVKEHS